MLELHCLETEKEAEDRDTRSASQELSEELKNFFFDVKGKSTCIQR